MDYNHIRQSGKADASSSSSSSSYSSSPTTPGISPKSPHSAGKQKTPHSRRPSLLSSALSKQECTTINIADDPEGPARLISYLSSSQGFAWNPEIFLPSYIDYEYVPLENRREPVHDIVLSDDEIKRILPQ
ncbi:hypothetical protein B0T26DRAFT_649331 [Lasiosphaeria miniovina]|uniref:Uncharacterized protein n=1 Tax=Lasiosphaeria miniovina TaxID=1954250 RepID=A0AA40AC27_9PEZI|nr:uncharacterized protein B0T26DRAFT_649331 [Lasiosphaeria miniovina]KAK0713108.1 hypothetical protein B0T26DRAFT_649331 [Lasiosphaeria miniovina]